MWSPLSDRTAGLVGWGVRVLELALVVGALALSVVLKLTLDAHGPLWLDEAWTGAVVGVRGWWAFARQAWFDVNPPLYFVLMHVWTMVFGLSAVSLRGPSVIAALATPAVVALVRTPGLSGSERLVWAAMLGLWGPGVYFAQEARGYALLILLSTLQTIAFVRLMRHPTRRTAALWAAAAAAALLTHYHMAFLILVQAVTLVVIYGRGLLRMWFALGFFVPDAAWIVIHLQRVTAFARPDVAWYLPITPHVLEQALDTFVGGWPILAGIGAVIVAGAVVERALGRRGATFSPGEGALWLATLTAIVASATVVGLGVLRPSFTPRYLVAFAPGALLGLVLAARNLSDNGARSARIALLGMAIGSAWHAARTQDPWSRRALQFQTASDALARTGVHRLVFLWDNPTDRALAPEERDALAGFFFRRSGHPVRVTGVQPTADADPNTLLVQAAGRDPDVGILWIYDLRVPQVAAGRFPPDLERLDPTLRCRRYVGGSFRVTPLLGVIACVRAPASLPPAPLPT